MKRRFKLTMTKVRRTTAVGTPGRACPVCGSHAEALLPDDAARFIDGGAVRLYEMLALGKIHVIPNADGSVAVCTSSILERE